MNNAAQQLAQQVAAGAGGNGGPDNFDSFGLFDGYAARILQSLVSNGDLKKASTTEEIEDVCILACQIARIMLDVRDDYWVAIYPATQN